MRFDRLARGVTGALALACALSAAAAGPLVATTHTDIGIFYQPGAPQTSTLWQDGDDGERLQLAGRVLSVSGRPIADALVELWHADAFGGVDESRFRASVRTRSNGSFALRTILPGHIEQARGYPTWAPRHIHVVVSHPHFQRLISLIYFAGDERLPGTPYPELAIVLDEARVDEATVLLGRVQIVLEAQ